MKKIRWLKSVVFCLTFVVIATVYFFDLKNQSLHEDEFVWVYRGGRHFQALFLDHNLTPAFWQHYYAYDQPKLAEFLMGAFTWASFNQAPDELFEETGFNQQGIVEMGPRDPQAWWVIYQAQEPQARVIPGEWQAAYQIIVQNRRLSVIFGLGLLLWVFLIGRTMGNFWIGLLSLILVAQHPLVFRESRQAMADSLLIFFLLGGLYWLMISQKRILTSSRLPALTLLGLGVWAGLSGSVKLNGFMVLTLMVAWLGLRFLGEMIKKNKAQRGKYLVRALVSVVIIVLTAGGVFTLINPFTWSNPIQRFQEMIVWRSQEAQKLQPRYPDSSYKNFRERLKAIVAETTLPQDGDQRVLQRLPAVAEVTILILSLVLVFFEAVIRQVKPTVTLFFFWLIGTLVIMSQYLTVGFDRYFLPIIPLLALLEAFGVVRLRQYLLSAGQILKE